jgi:sulfide:quinone oxidoreductase
MRVVVLGAGFGGLELTTRLSDELGDDVEVVLIDRSEDFVFGFSKLDVMFGRARSEAVRHPYAGLVKPGVEFVAATVTAIDPTAKRVETSQGAYQGDVLVIALGADLDPAATPGLLQAGHEFYTEAGAFALRDVLASFEGGRVVVGVTRPPFKCPPAPSETALLMHEHLTALGVRDQSEIALVMPLPVPIPPSPPASQAILAAFAERGIEFLGQRGVTELDPAERVARLSDGSALPFDLFLGVPIHRVPPVVEASGLTVDGWIPVDPLTLETSVPAVYALGDVASVGTPKAGVFAEGQASAVAARLIDQVRGDAPATEYDGRGICYLEFGADEVAKVDVTFASGQAPHGELEGPSSAFTAEKRDFGGTRIQRWFGRSWADLGHDH